MTTEHVSVPREWHLASLNDGLFIIDQKPSPSGTDVPIGMGRMNPSVVLNVTDLPQEKAQAIVDAHNAVLFRATPSDGCYACEGSPGPANNPCAVCGKSAKPSAPRVVTDEDVERALNVRVGAFPIKTAISGEAVRAILESFATSLPVAIPPGYVVVPVTPTNEMLHAGREALNASDALIDAWDEMLAAAPQAG